jgi:uncharacterized 2Fe-2S/4Fe-4S cluster protein (DUF4445 family)/DNA-binding MarR family transcriptional regulator
LSTDCRGDVLAVVSFIIDGNKKDVLCENGSNLLHIARKSGIHIDAYCGGSKKCGKCMVNVDGTDCLACEWLVNSDITVTIPSKKETEILTETGSLSFPLAKNLYPENSYGIAIDIGTTTIAAYLCKLGFDNAGTIVDEKSALNPQTAYGADVLSRISFSQTENGLEILRKCLFETLNELIEQFAEETGSEIEIVRVILAGNTVMMHIASGINPKPIGQYPYESVRSDEYSVNASSFGFTFPGADKADVVVLPCPKGFIGADAVAAIVSSGLIRKNNALLIDIGTNSEIALIRDGKVYVTSCATGPALEGASIEHGMRAAAGAISSLLINPITLGSSFEVIGDVLPVGICGSGIIDAAAQMAVTGVIEPSGKFTALPSEYINNKKFFVTDDIYISQKDIRAVQLAKAALFAGAQMLVRQINEENFKKAAINIGEIILAGAFGSKINIKNAYLLGMFPDCKLENVHSIGNAAGYGACMAFDCETRKKMTDIAENAIFIETALDKDYSKAFASAMQIPHENMSFSANFPFIFPCSAQHGNYKSNHIRILTQIRDYKYKNLSEISENSLLDEEDLSAAVKKITRDKYIVEIPGPFSLLCSLIDPISLFREKDKKLLESMLEKAAEELFYAAKLAVDKGAVILSVADSEGVIEIAGKRLFEDFSGKYALHFLKKISPFLENSLCHLCGKLSYSLQNSGMITAKTIRYDRAYSYKEALLQQMNNKNNRFFGHRCIHAESSAPILYKLELI